MLRLVFRSLQWSPPSVVVYTPPSLPSHNRPSEPKARMCWSGCTWLPSMPLVTSVQVKPPSLVVMTPVSPVPYGNTPPAKTTLALDGLTISVLSYHPWVRR